jgi:hypothetical protein
VHALRRAHDALGPGGILLDLMPYAPWVPVECSAGEVGKIDAREFARGARETEASLGRTVREGLFALERELRFDVLEHFDSGEALLEIVGDWGRTRIPQRVRSGVERASPPFRVREPVVLRRLRAL